MRITRPVGYHSILGFEETVANAGAVTVTAASTEIVAGSSFNVNAGDRIRVFFRCRRTMGAATGDQTVNIQKKAGTAVLTYTAVNESVINSFFDGLVGDVHHLSMAVEFKVTAGGTLQLQMMGISTGANSTVAIGDGAMRVERLTY